MTGRAAGYCAGHDAPGYANPVAGGGRGRGMGFRQGFGGQFGRRRGMGMGFRGGRQWNGGYGIPAVAYPPAPTAEQEASLLKTQARNLENALADIQKRLVGLESGK